ncbi:UvrD-helicase domain-containing protein [Cellulomonas algicola]|uniref:UvrD-helicase domain-containing protein n=1 Tax=Cellulomonas algicola TaxID=2071633 RepID=UPI001C3FBC45|nr:UvrD-helicase domain-containing protein [Cellulomonas algicola]
MTGHPPDASQLAAIDVPPNARQIVVAGPGSGKTEVVSNLVARLLEEGVDPAFGMFVVSFSNAAVNAVDARLRERGAAPITVQTMDSLAGEILHDLSDEKFTGFDRRIGAATRALADETWERFDALEHLVVDEIQDVVGVRADFLLAILHALPDECGFTLLGDPAQGIYDWQLRGEERPMSTTSSAELLARVAKMDGVEVKHLAGQYRARSRDARRAVALRDDALRGDPDGRLEEFLADLVPVGSVEEAAASAGGWAGTTVFLTRNNGQALLTAGAIAATGARVEVRRSAQQRVLASWIARVLGEHPAPGITREEIERRAVSIRPDLDPEALWRAMRSVVRGRGREVDLAALAGALRRPRPLIPDLLEPVLAPFVVSTVHRAKGLEFDNVVHVDFPDKPWINEPDESEDDEHRVLFVAVSRARDVLARADGPDDRRVRSSRRPDGARRWHLGGRAKWMTFGYELRADDLDRSTPPGDDPASTQRHLAERVRPGDPLTIRLDLRRSTLAVPVWELVHDEVVVGRTSAEFGEAFARRVGPRERSSRGWPNLSGARVEGMATIAGGPQQGAVGRYGLWLAPVCPGMLTIDWNGDRDD